MAVKLVREDENGRVPLHLLPSPPDVPPIPPRRAVATVEAIGVLTALAALASVRLVLAAGVLGAVGLTTFAMVQHSTLAVVASGVYDGLVLLPLIGLAGRKG